MSDDRLGRLESIAGPVSRETFESLLAFEERFRRWSASINLVAPSTLAELWKRHILDSAQLMRLAPATMRWLDLGSGGGFPGAIVAILLKDRPGSSISLVESNRKKAAFLQTSLSLLAAPARVFPMRIEDAPDAVEQPEIVTARALASLNDLMQLSLPWIERGARAFFHKGRDYRREVEESRVTWMFDLIEHPSAVDDDSIVLEIANLRRR